MLYLLIFICGYIEDFCNLIYYRLAQRGRKVLCSIVSSFRTLIWATILTGIVNNLDQAWYLVFIYALGGSFGAFHSLTVEPLIDKKILKLQRKGRKKKWGWLLGVKK